MAKYTVTHRCGHDEDVQLFGALDARYARRDQMAAQDCAACRGAKGAAAAQAAGLPALTGSAKQIAWAESIRVAEITRMTDSLTVQVEAAAKAVESGDAAKIEMAQLGLTILRAVQDEMIQQQTSASWWIDNRDGGAYSAWVKQATATMQDKMAQAKSR